METRVEDATVAQPSEGEKKDFCGTSPALTSGRSRLVALWAMRALYRPEMTEESGTRRSEVSCSPLPVVMETRGEDATVAPPSEGEKKDFCGASPALTSGRARLAALWAMRALSRPGMTEEFRIWAKGMPGNAEGRVSGDLYISYKMEDEEVENGGWFLQVLRLESAHVCEESTADESRDIGEPVDLTDSFQLFRKIKQNPELLGQSGDQLEAVILFVDPGTDGERRLGDLVLGPEAFRPMGNSIGCFIEGMVGFSEDFSEKKDLELLLKNSCVDLPKEFARKVILKENTLYFPTNETPRVGLEKTYWDSLLGEIVHRPTVRFQKGFVEGLGLSKEAIHFREEMWAQYSTTGSRSEKQFRSFLETWEFEPFEGPRNVQTSEVLSRHILVLLLKDRASKAVILNRRDPVIGKNITILMDFVFTPRERGYVFDSNFLEGKWLPGYIRSFRDRLLSQATELGLDAEVLGRYTFRLRDRFSQEIPSGEELDEEVKEFVGKLRFAPKRKAVEDAVDKCGECFRRMWKSSEAYEKLREMIQGFMGTAEGNGYITGKEIREFLEGLKKDRVQGLRYNFEEEPVIGFVGREALLGKVSRVLCEGPTKRLVISGLGGVGKTQLIREYANRHFPSEYDNVIWIDCEDGGKTEASFKDLAFGVLEIEESDEKGVKKTTQMVLRETFAHLTDGDVRTLLVFDNAGDERKVKRFFPTSRDNKSLYLVVTSRSKCWGGFHVMSLGVFQPEESMEFLKRSIGELRSWKDSEGRELAENLGNWPLALLQVVSYIRSKETSMDGHFSIPECVQQLKAGHIRLLDFQSREDDEQETAYKIMNDVLHSYKKIRTGKVANSLLNLISYISPGGIDLNSVRQAFPKRDRKQVTSCFVTLSDLGVASFENSLVDIHPVFQLVSRDVEKEGRERMEAIREALSLVREIDEKHRVSVCGHASQHGIPKSELEQVPPISTTDHLKGDARHMEAIMLTLNTLTAMKSPLTYSQRNALAEGESLEREFPSEGSDLVILESIAADLSCMRTLSMANERCYFETLHDYGVMLYVLDRYMEAMEAFEEILWRGIPILGRRSTLVYLTKEKMVLIAHETGIYNPRFENYRQEVQNWASGIVNMSETHWGKKWQSGVSSTNPTDQEMFRALDQMMENFPGRVSKKECLSNVYSTLALTYRVEGNHERAYRHLKGYHDILVEIYKECHPMVFQAKIIMLIELMEMGEYENVLKECEEFSQILESAKGYPKLLAVVKHFMGRALLLKGEKEEASAAFLDSVVGSDRKRIDERMLLASVLFLLEFLKAGTGDISGSVYIIQALFRALEENFGLISVPHQLLDGLMNCHQVIYDRGFKKEALELLKDVHRCHKVKYGVEELRTLEAKYFFATLSVRYGQKKAFERGLGHFRDLRKVLSRKVKESGGLQYEKLHRAVLFKLQHLPGTPQI